VQQRSNLSLYALYAGDFDAAAAEAQRVLKENPKFEVGVRTLALAKLAAGHLEEAQKEYGRLNDMSPRGASMAATGLADLAIYEGRLPDAVAILHKVIIENQADKDTDSAAFNQARWRRHNSRWANQVKRWQRPQAQRQARMRGFCTASRRFI